MSFVFERLNTPERQAEFRDRKIVSPITLKLADPETIFGWAVDRERGWYFLCLGGGAAEMPYFLVLADRNGAALNAHAGEKRLKDRTAGTVEITWTIDSIQVPKAHEARVDELTALMREALMVLAPPRAPEKVSGVRVEFRAPRGI